MRANNLTVNIYKIYKSHCNIDDLLTRRISLIDYLGNQYADSLARRGADLWQYPCDMVESINCTRGRAWRIGLRLAAVTVATAQIYNSSNSIQPVEQPIRRISLSELFGKLNVEGHLMNREGRRIFCGLCGLSGLYTRQQVNKMLARGPCKAVLGTKPVAGGTRLVEPMDEEDPFDLGGMDLDGRFASESPRQPLTPEPVADTQAVGEGDGRFLQGSLYVGVGSKPVHRTHRMMLWAGVHYCSVCGSWGVTRVQNLAKPCPGGPSPAGQKALSNIGNQRPPAPHCKLRDGWSRRPVLVTTGCAPSTL